MVNTSPMRPSNCRYMSELLKETTLGTPWGLNMDKPTIIKYITQDVELMYDYDCWEK